MIRENLKSHLDLYDRQSKARFDYDSNRIQSMLVTSSEAAAAICFASSNEITVFDLKRAPAMEEIGPLILLNETVVSMRQKNTTHLRQFMFYAASYSLKTASLSCFKQQRHDVV